MTPRIERRPDGIFHVAQPLGRPPTLFRLASEGATPGRAVFENPQHDFPQRITYQRRGDGPHVRIEGDGAGEQSQDWLWHRATVRGEC